MFRRLTLLAAAGSVLVFAGRAAAGVSGEWAETLDGTWRFSVRGDAPEGEWVPMRVPGNWDATPAFATHSGTGWYARDFAVPTEWRGKRLRLCFDAVYHDAEVTLNGKVLGGHSGGYTPFEFDVTGAVVFGGTNRVVVRADNTPRRGAWWPWGGISRSVTLRANHDLRITRQHIRATPDLARRSAKLVVAYRVANGGSESRVAELACALAGEAGVRAQRRLEIGPGATSEFEVDLAIPEGRAEFWHFDHPRLYTLEARLESGGSVMHARSDRFGIREVKVRPDGLYLNGERIRVAGFNRVSDSPATGNTEPDALVRGDVDLMKSAGAVMARLMHCPQAPNLLDYLDEKGMLIVAEIPVWGAGDPNVRADNPVTRGWLREMVERDFNHPCIIGWSPGNEIKGHYDYVRTMIAYLRELDPSRLAAYVSNTAAGGTATPENDPVGFGEIAFLNVYGENGERFERAARTLRARWPEQPVFFSEFGARQIGADPAAEIPGFASVWEAIAREPYVIGGAIWTFNDYRSGYRGTPPSGNREWGVVDVARRPKAAYHQVRRAFAPVRVFRFEGGAVEVGARGPEEIPSYTLRGYTVRWERRGGGVIGVSEVPALRPGDAPVRIPVLAGGADVARLITPTGYALAEAEREAK
jgi:beta-galactosidase/beta-glucuronidase